MYKTYLNETLSSPWRQHKSSRSIEWSFRSPHMSFISSVVIKKKKCKQEILHVLRKGGIFSIYMSAISGRTVLADEDHGI